MIFSLYPRVVIKAGGERYEFDRTTLMFTEVVQIEKATGMSFGEWQTDLGRYSLAAVGALIHMLRRREGLPSDFETMSFGELSGLPSNLSAMTVRLPSSSVRVTRRKRCSQVISRP